MVKKIKIPKIYIKEIFLNIGHNFKRFLSLVCIIAIGVCLFVGMRSATLDLNQSMLLFFQETNLSDLEIFSSSGIKQKTLNVLKKDTPEIKEVHGGFRKDVIANIDGEESAIVVNGYDTNQDYNQIRIISGRLPEENNECVVESILLEKGYEIGDVLSIQDDSFLNQDLVIVGSVDSSLYISHELGSTSLLSGELKYFIYVTNENFNLDDYNIAYVVLDHSYDAFSNQYINYTSDLKDEVEDTLKNYTVSELTSTQKNYDQLLSLYKNGTLTNVDDMAKLQGEILTLQNTIWHVATRNDNAGYSQYKDDIERVSNLSYIFPILFLFVSVFITIMSIERMVNEDRIKIGTYFALGYGKLQVFNRYIVYVVIAIILGSAIGIPLGTYIIPKVFYSIYSLLYFLPKIHIVIDYLSYILSIGTFSVAILTSTVLSCKSTFNELPANLMRPKVEKGGHLSLIEHISFLNRHLKLPTKILFRNIFLYKKRFFMTIVGVSGCIALIIVGFALRNSISEIVKIQYNDIFSMNAQLFYGNLIEQDKMNSEMERISNMENINNVVESSYNVMEAKNNGKTYSIQMVSPKNLENFKNVVKVQNQFSREEIKIPDDGAVISAKIAKLLNVSAGDDIVLFATDNNEYRIHISDITENYVFHYLYLSQSYYKKIFEKEPEYNMLLVSDDRTMNENDLAKEFNKNNAFSQISFLSASEEYYDLVTNSLNIIVSIIIIAAGVLYFVVLYSLSNINISERRKELATLKVLGFTKHQVNNYIKKEMHILICIGIAMGMVVGFYLSQLVIHICEMDSLMYYDEMQAWFFIMSIAITFCFSILTDISISKNVAKIDMVESLKQIS